MAICSQDADKIYTKAWWQAKAGWSDQEYETRLLALHYRLESKWAGWLALVSPGQTDVQELTDWLRPLILLFDDSNWCNPDVTTFERLDYQLKYYIGWAMDFKMKATKVEVINSLTKRYEGQLIPRRNLAFSSPICNDTRFDWDEVEVLVDAQATCAHRRTIVFPMADIGDGARPYIWRRFRYDTFITKVRAELNLSMWDDTGKWQFVCVSKLSDHDDLKFSTDSSYRIALKRFEKVAEQNGYILRLRIERDG